MRAVIAPATPPSLHVHTSTGATTFNAIHRVSLSLERRVDHVIRLTTDPVISRAPCQTLRPAPTSPPLTADRRLPRVIRSALVLPFIESHVTPEALDGAGPSGSCDGLGAVYAGIITFAKERLLPLCGDAREALGAGSRMSR